MRSKPGISRAGIGVQIAALLLLMAACGSGQDAAEPKTTKDEPAMGYVESIPRDLEELPEFTDVALRGKVTKITSLLNTQSGGWNPASDMTATELHNLFAELVPITRIHVQVESILGRRQESSLDVATGGAVVVTLLGGTAQIDLSPEEARAIGITIPIKEGEGEPNQGADNQTYPTGTTGLTTSMEPGAYLIEGDSVIVFLSRDMMDLYPGPVQTPVTLAVDHAATGFFRLTGASEYENAVSGKAVHEMVLTEVAASISDQSGMSRSSRGTY